MMGTGVAAGSACTAASGGASGVQAAALVPQQLTQGCPQGGPCPTRRQKSWDALDPSAMAQARLMKASHLTQVQVSPQVDF